MAEREIIKEPYQTKKPAHEYLKANGEYLNLSLTGYQGGPELAFGDYIQVKKHPEYAETMVIKEGMNKWDKPWKLHKFSIIVEDESGTEQEASFLSLDEQEVKAFNNVAGVGEPIEISRQKYLYEDARGTERAKDQLTFRKAQD